MIRGPHVGGVADALATVGGCVGHSRDGSELLCLCSGSLELLLNTTKTTIKRQ